MACSGWLGLFVFIVLGACSPLSLAASAAPTRHELEQGCSVNTPLSSGAAFPFASPVSFSIPFPRLLIQVRHELEQGHSVKYLLPDSVIQYIYQHGLYNTAASRPALLHVGEEKVDSDTD